MTAQTLLATANPRARRRATCARVLDEAPFREALLRERYRADRFDRPFLLLLLSAPAGATSAAIEWEAVGETLARVTRGTDLLGWFEQGSTLGIILPDASAEPAVSSAIESRVRCALKAAGGAVAAAVDIEACAHAPSQAVRIRYTPADRLIRSRRTMPRAGVRAKRALDVVGSATLLALLSPLLLAIAVVVRLSSSGPVLFRQERIGQRLHPFRMLKFRSMYVDSDAAIHQQYATQFITEGAAAQGSGKDAVFKIVGDPRVTPVGRFLRRTSFDELPQLWNVLCGEMSLVGPRPPLAYEIERYKPWHCRRVLDAKPGVTGLWQVTGRSRTTFDEMVRLDLHYARTCSVWTDLKILLATPLAVLTGRGAM